MWTLLWTFFGTMRSLFRTQRELALENLALRQQVGVLTRTRGGRRLRLGVWDRAFWVILSKRWAGWRESLVIVEPATVVRWHRQGFRRFWYRRSQAQRPGRPGLDREVVRLIRRMAQANATWGAPRIRNELAMLGIDVAVSTVARHMPRRRRPPSQNAYAERIIGSLRRECLDQVIVLDEMHLLRILANYFEYYNETRCHLSLAGDAPQSRVVQGPELGEVVELPKVGGLHHRYERAA